MRRLASLLLGLAILTAGCTAGEEGNDNDEQGTPPAARAWVWSGSAMTMTARGEVGCASDGTRHILVAGGIVETPVATEAFAATASTEIYDNETDTWSEGPVLPVPIHHLAVAHGNGRYWALGGYPGPSFTPTSTVFSWAPGEANWTPHEPMPVARGAHGAGVIADRIYVVGGVTPEGVTSRVDVLNTTSGKWQRLEDAPTAREHLAVDAGAGVVYVAGGRAGAFDSTIEAFDRFFTRNGTWQGGPPLPTPRGGSAGAAGPLGFIVAGGEGTSGTFGEIELYAHGAPEWERLPEDPDPRHGLCVVALGESFHFIAGGLEAGFATSRIHNVLSPE